MKLPAIQFYPADWRKDPGIQALSYEERGVWFELLCLMHESSKRGYLFLNGKAISEERLAIILNLDNHKVKQILTTLLDCGVASLCEETGAIVSRRMVRDDLLIQIRRNAGKQGGNPILLKQKTTTPVKQNPTPSSSSSSSTTVIPHTPKTERVVDNSFAEFWNAYPRKEGKAKAVTAWGRVKSFEIQSLMGSLDAQKKSESWQKEAGRFIPHPASWLNGRRWEDELSESFNSITTKPIPTGC